MPASSAALQRPLVTPSARTDSLRDLPTWRNWYTRYVQGPLSVRTCEFETPHRVASFLSSAQ